MLLVVGVEVTVDLTGADDSGSRWAAGLGLEAPDGLEGPPVLSNLPFDMGFATPGFFFGTGLETLFGGSPEGT